MVSLFLERETSLLSDRVHRRARRDSRSLPSTRKALQRRVFSPPRKALRVVWCVFFARVLGRGGEGREYAARGHGDAVVTRRLAFGLWNSGRESAARFDSFRKGVWREERDSVTCAGSVPPRLCVGVSSPTPMARKAETCGKREFRSTCRPKELGKRIRQRDRDATRRLPTDFSLTDPSSRFRRAFFASCLSLRGGARSCVLR